MRLWPACVSKPQGMLAQDKATGCHMTPVCSDIRAMLQDAAAMLGANLQGAADDD